MRRYLIAVTILICLWCEWTHSTSTHPEWYVSDITRIVTGVSEAPYRTRVLLPLSAWAISGGDDVRLYTALALFDLLSLGAALVTLHVLLDHVLGREAALSAFLFAAFLLVSLVIYGGGFIAWSWLEMALLNGGLLICWHTLRLPRWSSSPR